MASSKNIYPCFALLCDSFPPRLTIYIISQFATLILKENTVELYATLSLHSQWNVIDYFLSLWWLDEWIVKTQTPILQLNIVIDSFEASYNDFLRHSIICDWLTMMQILSSFTRKRISTWEKAFSLLISAFAKFNEINKGSQGDILR